MKPVSDEVIKNIKRKGRGSAIFSPENIAIMESNPNQWYEITSVVDDVNYKLASASQQSSARYFQQKLGAKEGIKLQFRSTQNKDDKSAILYARIVESTNNGTD